MDILGRCGDIPALSSALWEVEADDLCKMEVYTVSLVYIYIHMSAQTNTIIK